jgi:putative copper resistance protein D
MRGLTWYAGLAVLLWATCGAPAIYGRVLFSAHMIGHMTVGMVVPLLLVAAAPITLALRTLPVRHDGTRGPREWLLVAVESRPLRALGHPVVAAVLFTGSLIVFYHSPLFGLALRTHVGHELMFVHFLLTGYLFVWMLVGVDPGPRRPPPAARLVVLLATMGFHAFFGVTLVSGTAVLEPEWFTALGRTWGDDALADQKVGGGIAWAVGELPTLVLALLIAVQWSRSDAREARRLDRRADRDGDADLTAYNAMLAGMADRPAAGRAAEPVTGPTAAPARVSPARDSTGP